MNWGDFATKVCKTKCEKLPMEPNGNELLMDKIQRYKISGHRKLKGIVSRDIEGLQMILMNRAWVPCVPQDFFIFFSYNIKISKF